MGVSVKPFSALCLLLGPAVAVTNPSGFVLDAGFADPRSIYYDGTYYAFATNNPLTNTSEPTRNVPVATSKDFSTGWSYDPSIKVLPDPGSWTAQPPDVWDPAVQAYNDTHFVMYYAAAYQTTSKESTHCIGAATATSILGTYKPQSTPLICSDNNTLYISPNPFTYQGKQYIVHKAGNDANSAIHLQQLTADGTELLGGPVELYHETGSEFDTEGPVMTFNPNNNNWPILLFVTGYFESTSYSIHYAAPSTNTLIPPKGELYVLNDTPLLQTGVINGQDVSGPGGPDFPSLAHSPYQMTFMADPNNQTYLGRSMRTANLTYGKDNTLSILPN